MKKPAPLLTVTALYITDSADSYQQLDLLGGAAAGKNEKQEKLESAMDAIRDKYGKGAIAYGTADGKVGWED